MAGTVVNWPYRVIERPTMPVGPQHKLLTNNIAIDCEMISSDVGQVLGHISVVNYDCETIFDTFGYYPPTVAIINTDEAYSGIRWNDINPQNRAQPFDEV